MSISIQEKVDQLTTNLMEVAGIPDTIAGLYNKIDPTTRNILFVGGGLAGFRGGRQTGAAILGAGAAGGPAGLAFGPYAGIAGAIAGGGIGSDIAQSYVRAKKGLQAGGDPYNLVFRQG